MVLGEDKHIFGNWFILHFTENPGMAFGIKWGGEFGKILLTSFRIIAIGFIGYFILRMIKKNAPTGFVMALSLIFVGALGNIIDSVFYGLLFDHGTTYNAEIGRWSYYIDQASLNFEGYAPLFKGCVVDMLYFPIIQTTWPDWLPLIGGNSFEFFKPVFNIADSAITTGVFIILLFYRSFLKKL
jgi:signal peptidase II